MGQRTFRGQYIDNLAKDYYKIESSSEVNNKDIPLDPNNNTINKCYLRNANNKLNSEYLINLDYLFDLSKPFGTIKDIESVRTGILNCYMSANKKIEHLKLKIKTPFNENKIYQNFNFNLLFGIYFIKDINNIDIKIIYESKEIKNSNNEIKNSEDNILTNIEYQDNREIMSSIMEYMVFKSYVNVVINNKFIYHIQPGFNNHSTILSYKSPLSSSINSYDNTNNKCDSKEYIESLLKDFLYHSYSVVKGSFTSLQNLKLSINKSFSNNAKNIILPRIELCNYNKEINGILGFFKFLKLKFKFVSIEFIVLDKSYNLYGLMNELKSIIANFEYIIISFEFRCYIDEFTYNNNTQLYNITENLNRSNQQNLAKYNSDISIDINKNCLSSNNLKEKENLILNTAQENAKILKSKLRIPFLNQINCLEEFKKFMHYNKLEKLTIAEHVYRKAVNNKTSLIENINLYFTINYNRSLSEGIYSILFAFLKHKNLKKVKKIKHIMNKLFELVYGIEYKKNFYSKRKFDFSTTKTKNTKIVTF